jgi:hypothetical protein
VLDQGLSPSSVSTPTVAAGLRRSATATYDRRFANPRIGSETTQPRPDHAY